MSTNATQPSERLISLAAMTVTLACMANMLRSVVFPSDTVQPYDFICFWTAGQAWLAGVSPYDMAEPINAVPSPFEQWAFVYPPATRLLFEPFARLPLDTGWQAFKIAQVCAWGAVCLLTARRLPPTLSYQIRVAILAAFIGGLSYPALSSTQAGQTVAFLAAAIAWLLSLPQGRANWLRVAAILVVLSFKPQLGLPIAVVVVLRWADWRAVAAASLGVIALTLWGCAFQPALMLPEFVANLGIYADQGPNGVGERSGLPIILHALGAPNVPGIAWVLLSVAAATACAVSPLKRERALCLAMFAMFLIQPNHEHAYLLAIPLLPILLTAPQVIRAVILGAFVLSAQAMVIASFMPTRTIADFYAVSVVIDTVCVALIAAATAWWLVLPRRERTIVPGLAAT